MYAQKEKHTTEEVTVTVDARKKKKSFTPPGIIQSIIHHWEIQSYSTGKTSDHPSQQFSHHASTLHSSSLDILSEVVLFILNLK